jgi:DNA replication and repair protein RecF
MFIKKIELLNFRNYSQLNIEPFKGLNILVGKNAQGKSAVLEAVYVLSTSKSHRTNKDLDIIKINQSFAKASVKVTRDKRNNTELDFIISNTEGKSVKVDGAKKARVSDLVGELNSVIFSSEDLNIIKGEPSVRRRFLNLEISQLSPQYMISLGRYKRALEQRNMLLKEIRDKNAEASQLSMWDIQLVEYGSVLVEKRMKFIESLSKTASEIYSSISGESENLAISYNSGLLPEIEGISINELYFKKLINRRELDIMRGNTSAGPHRDDFDILIADMVAKEFASQGQQRTAAISVKLAEIDVMEDTSGESPVVLLDDVMAELDEIRRSRVLKYTADRCQTFITTTHLSELDKELITKAQIFEIEAGKVINGDNNGLS